ESPAQDEPSAEDKEETEVDGAGESSARVLVAQEVSESITQQAMDDSMRELSRRTSAASSIDSSIADPTAAAAPTITPATNVTNDPGLESTNFHDEMDEEVEDCK